MKVSKALRQTINLQLCGQDLILDAGRSVYWPDQQTLIVSDLHLGKAGHFRKNGVPVPKKIHFSDLQRLDEQVRKYKPDRLIFLGDLFHSDENLEWQDFISWSASHKSVRQILVEGNHDILDEASYAQTVIELVPEWVTGPFRFTHEPVDSEVYNIAGHIHPGVRLRGPARQGMVMPCFYFGRMQGILPAFGNFTGSYVLNPKKGDRIFALMEGAIIGLIG